MKSRTEKYLLAMDAKRSYPLALLLLGYIRMSGFSVPIGNKLLCLLQLS